MKYIAIIFALVIAGCSLQPIQTKEMKAACQQAHTAQYCEVQGWVFETYAWLNGFNQTIAQNADAKVWTKVQAQGYLDKSKSVRKATDDVADALLKNEIPLAIGAQKVALKALLELQREAAQARK